MPAPAPARIERSVALPIPARTAWRLMRRSATFAFAAAPLLRRWDRRLSVVATGSASCRYTDEVDLDAGRPTAIVAPLARAFFAHRQRRRGALAAVPAPEDEAAWPA